MTMSIGAQELSAFIQRNKKILGRMAVVAKGLAAKKASSKYRHDRAVEVYRILVDVGATMWAKEFGDDDPEALFPASDRKQVAEALAKDFEVRYARATTSAKGRRG